jgi:hypothetical protein
MKNILLNTAILYLLRFTALFIAFPIEGVVSKYLLNNDKYAIEYFSVFTLWFFFLGSLIYAIIWAIFFYIGCNLFKQTMNAKLKIGILSFLIFILETLLNNLHHIFYNKTFFSREMFQVDFFQYLIGQIMIFFTFLYLYIAFGRRIIKRPTILP